MKQELFHSLGPRVSADFEAICHARTYPQGVRMFHRGEPAQGIFVLSSGSAKLTMDTSAGRSVIVRVANADDVLGLSAAMSNRPYEATAEALEPTRVRYLDRLDFYRFLQTHGQAYQRVIEHLSTELLAAYDHMTRNSVDEATAREFTPSPPSARTWAVRFRARARDFSVPVTAPGST